MLRRWLASLVLGAALCASCQSLRPGDLLFHVAPQDNAITSVTPGMIDHVALCINRDSVIEAIGTGVVITHIDTVLTREEGHYLRGRIKGVDAKRTLQNARRYLGRPYDRLYLPNDSAIYCSELIQLSAVNHRGEALLETIPMSFHDATGRITDYWRTFYQQQGMSVPEGWPGTNPGELSQRPIVELRPLK